MLWVTRGTSYICTATGGGGGGGVSHLSSMSVLQLVGLELTITEISKLGCEANYDL